MKVMLIVQDDSGRTFEGEAILSPTRKAVKQTSNRRAPSGSTNPRTPTQGLKHLHAHGFFKTERDLGAVEGELAKVECHFPKSSLATALDRANFLTRRGSRGNYRYIQKFGHGG